MLVEPSRPAPLITSGTAGLLFPACVWKTKQAKRRELHWRSWIMQQTLHVVAAWRSQHAASAKLSREAERPTPFPGESTL